MAVYQVEVTEVQEVGYVYWIEACDAREAYRKAEMGDTITLFETGRASVCDRVPGDVEEITDDEVIRRVYRAAEYGTGASGFESD